MKSVAVFLNELSLACSISPDAMLPHILSTLAAIRAAKRIRADIVVVGHVPLAQAFLGDGTCSLAAVLRGDVNKDEWRFLSSLDQSSPWSAYSQGIAPGELQQVIFRGQSGSGTERITLRGIGGDTLREVTLQGRYLEEHGSKAEAIEAYEKAVSMIAEPLNDLAWLYQSDGKTEEAAALSQLAVSMRQDPRFLDTLAEIKFKNGDHTSAIKLLEKAVALNPSLELREKLTRFRNASQ